MKNTMVLLFAALLIVSIIPGVASAQEGNPPVCCDQEPPPPPPPEGGDGMASGSMALTMPLTTISDATLAEFGMTRTQFLSQLAAALFPDPAQTIYLLIPVYSQTVAADGTIAVSVSLLQVELGAVSPEIINATDTVFLTNGTAIMQMTFVPEQF